MRARRERMKETMEQTHDSTSDMDPSPRRGGYKSVDEEEQTADSVDVGTRTTLKYTSTNN